MKKKILIIIISVIVLIGIVIGVIFLINKNKKIEVYPLEIVESLESSDSAKAANMVKDNVVKIVNKIDDKKVIYGTGFFDKSGYLVTNSHVVDIKGDVRIVYSNGKESKATLFSNDIVSDIALLSVADVKVKALPFKSTLNLEVTNEVYSIGYQLNLNGEASVTKGILSAKRVASGIEFLQTDAAVNSGGSGGPVINDKGEVLGMVTLASDNATLSFAISSDTLELYISKLINNKKVTYITESRESNALSSVLKEVNYKDIDDIYGEKEFLKPKEENKKEENKHEDDHGNNDFHHNDQKHHNNNNNNAPTEIPKPQEERLEISAYEIQPILANSKLSNKIEDYFFIDGNSSSCKLDTSQVDVTRIGKYKIYLNCSKKSASSEIEVYGTVEPNYIEIPYIEMDETKNNVTSFEQIAGTWYYPGYRDTCSVFSSYRGIYEWASYSYDWYVGDLFYNMGGGSQYRTEEELLSQAKFWVSGNFLVITTDMAQYTLTRIKGNGVYDERYYFESFCD